MAPLPSLDVYPNPSAGQVFLTGSLNDNRALDCKIYDTTGKLIHTASLGQFTSGTWSAEVDLSQLPNGTYLLHIEDELHELMSSEKITIVK